MNDVSNLQRHSSPVPAPQALACQGDRLWLSSRDLGTLYVLDAPTCRVIEELDPPGVIWAAALTADGWRFTVGKGSNDDRYIYRYSEVDGFARLFACPEMTGSYLSFDGDRLYLSQWYKGHIHQLDDSGTIRHTFDVGEEICGHTFAGGMLYVLRGRENKDGPGEPEQWRLGRLDPHKKDSKVEELAIIPFASRSLAFDGEKFWSNHRAANEVVSFTL